MSQSTTRREFLITATPFAAIAAGAVVAGRRAVDAAEQAEAAKPGWKAGVARVVITPDTPVWLAGYGTKRAPDGKLHDLWAKALAIEDQAGHRAVLITSDFQGVPRMMSDQVFDRLHRKFGLERAQVMLTFSHNHCGPRLGDDLVDYYPSNRNGQACRRIHRDMVERLIDSRQSLSSSVRRACRWGRRPSR